MRHEKIFQMEFGRVYGLLLDKALRKGRTEAEVDAMAAPMRRRWNRIRTFFAARSCSRRTDTTWPSAPLWPSACASSWSF